uniref:Uncharacterized protein n=1 Tax=Onchocerca volvulus TaxID=6282 RepID=A0A8R1U2V7_ONCVO
MTGNLKISKRKETEEVGVSLESQKEKHFNREQETNISTPNRFDFVRSVEAQNILMFAAAPVIDNFNDHHHQRRRRR